MTKRRIITIAGIVLVVGLVVGGVLLFLNRGDDSSQAHGDLPPFDPNHVPVPEITSVVYFHEHITRGQFVRLIVEVFEVPVETEAIFSDVPERDRANAWITAAVRRGIIVPGEYGAIFGVDEPVTQEKAILWMIRALGLAPDRNAVRTAWDVGLVSGEAHPPHILHHYISRGLAAEFIASMTHTLHGLARAEREVFRYVFRRDVAVIADAPAFNHALERGELVLTFHNPGDEIRQLGAGDTFVLEPTAYNPHGMAGTIINTLGRGDYIDFTVRPPRALDELFDVFMFSGEMDVLAGEHVFFSTEGELHPDDWTEIVRNGSEGVTWAFSRTLNNINVRGRVQMHRPVLRANIDLRHIDKLVLATGAQLDVHVYTPVPVDRVFTVGAIYVPITGMHIRIPVGVRVTSNGQVELDFTSDAQVEFGVSHNRGFAIASMAYDFHGHMTARMSTSLYLRAEAGLMGTLHTDRAFGIEGAFGRGFETNAAMQRHCPTGTSFVVRTFPIRKMGDLNLSPPRRRDYHFISGVVAYSP
ncbi:MAG: hypothetical protein FWB88_06245 [Defluviitaleaceae bacterium]|nr:hypothetical protein [Defluviitaleaceae bacterium]MCL2240812.1 hypothetical protein [Defluviitaleaceae bacterium]